MQTIYKYALPIEDHPAILMPYGSQVLCVQTQNNLPYIWAMVDDEAKTYDRKFTVVGTGHDCDTTSKGRYIGTVQMHDGALVLHVFSD